MINITTPSFLKDTDKISLTKDDLFDRIINLKLTTGKEVKGSNGETVFVKYKSYTIRSDYEVVYPSLDVTKVMQTGNVANTSYYVRKCRFKPSIKIHYTKVSPSSPIDIDIYVSNFFMTDSEGQRLMSFNNEDFPLKQVEIMMGYWGQFKNIPHEKWEDINTFPEGNYGITKIVCGVQYVTTDKLPPDSVLHIHGWVGSCPYSTDEGGSSVTTYEKATDNNPLYTGIASVKEGQALEDMFFNHITRRFIKDSVTDSVVKRDKNGLMSVMDAQKYGVKVSCSEGVKELSKANIESKAKDAEGNDVEKKIYFNVGSTADNTLNSMLSSVNNRLFKATNANGDFLIHLDTESSDIETLGESIKDITEENNTAVKYYGHVLPAVYNINIDSLATITAPFWYVINPYDYVIFKNRYSLSNLVTYFTNTGGNTSVYWVIKQSVSFATVEDINEMTLICQASVPTGE